MTTETQPYITREVIVDLGELIDRDLEGVLDLLSTLATGTDLLMDITYNVTGVGAEPNTLILAVSGDTSAIEETES